MKPFLGVETYFFEWNLISINILWILNIFFNFDNLEPASGRPAPELEVKARKIVKLDVLEQAPGCPNKKKIFDIRKIY